MLSLTSLIDARDKLPGERVVHVTNHASATKLQAYAVRDESYSSRVILNSSELEKELNTRVKNKWIKRPLGQIGEALLTAASASTLTIGEIQFGMGGLASIDKRSATATSFREALFVFEDSIDSTGFGKLLSYYSSTEPNKMPTIIVAAEKGVIPLQEKLCRYNNNFVFHEFYGSNSAFWSRETKTPVMSLADIIQGFVQNNTLAVANTDFSLDGVDHTDFDEFSQSLSAAYAIIRSVNFEFNKFASAKLMKKVLKIIEKADSSKLSDDQRNIFYTLQALFLLWDLYLNENKPFQLDTAIELSSRVGSELLKAHCFRLINLSAGYSALSQHKLQEAEKIFRRFNQDPMAIYCKNNTLLNVMHQEGCTTHAFKDLIAEATQTYPNIFSMVCLLNNAGVGAMLDSRYEEALEIFDDSKKYNALPIHRIGLDVNRLLCRFTMGDTLCADDLERIAIRIQRENIDYRYGYHQTIILFNILRMQENLGYSSKITRRLLKAQNYMSYNNVLSGKMSVANYLAKNLPTTAPQGKYKGQRGDFILRTDLVPIIHFCWS